MEHRFDIRLVGLLSLCGLSLVWSPMFGTSEALVFPALAAFPHAVLISRICNLAAFGLVMGVMSFIGERVRGMLIYTVRHLAALVGVGCVGMLLGALAALGVLPLFCLYAGATLRGLFYGLFTLFWIDVLIHVEDDLVGTSVSAALVLYAAAGLILCATSQVAPAITVLLLVLCPALSCWGCKQVGKRIKTEAPVEQGSAKAPLRTRLMLYAANFLFGIMLGALLYYFARFDTLASVTVFLCMSLALFVVFARGSQRFDAGTVFRGLMLCFALVMAPILISGVLSRTVAVLAASAALSLILLYVVLIFTDTQARMQKPYWKVPGMCQVFASLGMIAASALFQAAFPDGDISGAQLVLLACLCLMFIAGVFSPSSRARVRPWGFSSLIPEETPEARAQRRCGELAEECGLTGRELEILLLLAAGRTKDDIAQSLVISPTTAKTHIRNIYGKLGVHSHAEVLAKLDQ